MSEKIHGCRRCYYEGTVETFDPSFGLYSDIKCPKCGSTNIEMNDDFSKQITDEMRRKPNDT